MPGMHWSPAFYMVNLSSLLLSALFMLAFSFGLVWFAVRASRSRGRAEADAKLAEETAEEMRRQVELAQAVEIEIRQKSDDELRAGLRRKSNGG